MGNQSYKKTKKKMQELELEEQFHTVLSSIEKLDENIGKMSKIMNKILGKEMSLSQNNEPSEMEDRFQTTLFPVPQLTPKNSNFEIKLKCWLSNLLKKVFSHTFKKYESGLLSQKQMKVYCSENILLNIINCIQKNSFTKETIHLINDVLKTKLLPYCLLKYPQSEEAQVNLSLNDRVKKIDDFQNNQIDLIYKSEIQFERSKQKNYNAKIMQFLNFIIKLPGSKRTEQNASLVKSPQLTHKMSVIETKQSIERVQEQSEEKTIFQTFQNDFESLFERLKDEEDVHYMKNMNSNSDIRQFAKRLSRNFSDDLQRKRKYREKVETYTKYLLGRKLSENTKPFTSEQIESGNLTMKSSALMRIITKWCEQLRKNFKDPQKIAHKEGQFRMKDGTERYLNNSEAVLLEELLEKREQQIEKYLKQIRNDNYKHQSNFGRYTLPQNDAQLLMYTEEEAKVGIFATVSRKNNENYLIGYLNILIHNLLAVMQEFENICFYKARNDYDDQLIQNKALEDLDNLIFQAQSTAKKFKKSQIRDKVPSLITFKVSDLLRCKCSSKQMEINALYNQISKISHNKPEFLRIVRVKNRLDRGTRDVLINLMFREHLVVQMQLAINTNKSRFIDCSDKFNHYIYELMRSQFGPLSELCSIWTNLDPRSSFYTKLCKTQNQHSRNKKLEELLIVKKLKQSLQTLKISINHTLLDKVRNNIPYQQISLPFRCDNCLFYYTETNYAGPHRYYSDIQQQMCFSCVLSQLNSYQSIKKQIVPELPELPEQMSRSQKQDILRIRRIEEFPTFGILVRVKSRNREIKYFRVVKNGKKMFAFQRKNQKLNNLGEVTSKKQKQIFLKQNIVFSYPELVKKVDNLQEKNIMYDFFVPKFFQSAASTERTSIKLVKSFVREVQIDKIKAPLHSVKKANFAENQLEKIQFITNKFPNLSTLILYKNNIFRLNSIGNLKHLKKLNLFENNIQKLPDEIGLLEKLNICDLSSNYIKALPDSFGNLESLKKLNLQKNEIKTLPETFGKLNLEQLEIYENQLKQLPQAFGDLDRLKLLNISKNKIIYLPSSFGGLKSLNYLFMSNNNVQILSDNFGELPLIYLQLQNNNLTSLPIQFGNLTKLVKLNISGNHLCELPQSFPKLFRLQKFVASANKISLLPQKFGDLVRLKKLWLSENKLSYLPQSFGKLTLQEAYFNKNYLKKLPQSFGQLFSLKKLSISQNKLEVLPQKFGNLVHLVFLELSLNQLTVLPDSFGNLRNLRELRLSQNNLSYLPETFGDLQNLKELNLIFNKLQLLPESFGKLKIEEVYLQNNKLAQLPQSFCELKQLRTLSFPSNSIRNISFINELTSLQSLYIQGNPIKRLPKGMQNLDLKFLSADEDNLDKKSKQIFDIIQQSIWGC